MAENMKSFTLRLPDETIELLEAAAVATDKPISQHVRQAFEEFVVRHGVEIYEEIQRDLALRQAAADRFEQWISERQV